MRQASSKPTPYWGLRGKSSLLCSACLDTTRGWWVVFLPSQPLCRSSPKWTRSPSISPPLKSPETLPFKELRCWVDFSRALIVDISDCLRLCYCTISSLYEIGAPWISVFCASLDLQELTQVEFLNRLHDWCSILFLTGWEAWKEEEHLPRGGCNDYRLNHSGHFIWSYPIHCRSYCHRIWKWLHYLNRPRVAIVRKKSLGLNAAFNFSPWPGSSLLWI